MPIQPRRSKNFRRLTILSALALLLCLAPLSAQTTPQTTTGPSTFKIAGNVTTPLEFSAADLKKLSRKTLTVVNSHEKKSQVYEGVLLRDLLSKAGVPQAGALRGPVMATYVLAEAADGYRIIFSLAELDPDFLDSEVIVADTMDGTPLGPGQGPFKLVAPHDKRPARWIRMLKSITVVQPPA